MFEELARLKFFIPKQNPKYRYKNDNWPFVVMENIADQQYEVRGKFAEEKYALIFLEQLRNLYVAQLKAEAMKMIEETVQEQSKQ